MYQYFTHTNMIADHDEANDVAPEMVLNQTADTTSDAKENAQIEGMISKFLAVLKGFASKFVQIFFGAAEKALQEEVNEIVAANEKPNDEVKSVSPDSMEELLEWFHNSQTNSDGSSTLVGTEIIIEFDGNM